MLPVDELMVRQLVPLTFTAPLHADHPFDTARLLFCCKFQPLTFCQDTFTAPPDVLIDKGGAAATTLTEPVVLTAKVLLIALAKPEADAVIV